MLASRRLNRYRRFGQKHLQLGNALMNFGFMPADARHIIDKQLSPMLLGSTLAGIDTALACTNLTRMTDGYVVHCYECGASATIPFQLKPGQVVMCPACVAKRQVVEGL